MRANFGDGLKKVRTARGMTTTVLARAAKVNGQTLSQWERYPANQLPRDAKKIERVALALGLTFAELLTEGGFIARVSQ